MLTSALSTRSVRLFVTLGSMSRDDNIAKAVYTGKLLGQVTACADEAATVGRNILNLQRRLEVLLKNAQTTETMLYTHTLLTENDKLSLAASIRTIQYASKCYGAN